MKYKNTTFVNILLIHSHKPGKPFLKGAPFFGNPLYSKVSDAISLIIKAGHGALMGRVDIKRAYPIIPVHPSDRHLLGMFWQGGCYLHLALLFGLGSAPAIFNSLANLFHWRLVNNWNVRLATLPQ